ncbi:fumarate reductase cytochrome b subunit [Colwelliaceae bacterium 6471]
MRTQAQLDLWQSVSGLLLGLFLWVHLILVSSIIISQDAMAFIASTMEASFLSDTGEGYPIIVSIIALVIFILLVIHAVLAMRKLPSNWQQQKQLQKQLNLIPHDDTKNWRIQAVSGVAIMFLVPAHIFVMFSQPDTIGPITSSIRIAGDGFWMLYLPLLIVAELHAAIGLYRLCLKWGWFIGKDVNKRRQTLIRIKQFISVTFILIGLLTLYTYYTIGVQHS